MRLESRVRSQAKDKRGEQPLNLSVRLWSIIICDIQPILDNRIHISTLPWCDTLHAITLVIADESSHRVCIWNILRKISLERFHVHEVVPRLFPCPLNHHVAIHHD